MKAQSSAFLFETLADVNGSKSIAYLVENFQRDLFQQQFYCTRVI